MRRISLSVLQLWTAVAVLSSSAIAQTAAAQTAVVQTAAVPLPPQIVTSGTAEARVAPDRATISIGLQTRSSTSAAAAADNARRQRAVLDTLRALGIPADQLATVNYNVSPDMQYSPNGQTPPKVVGYVVTNNVRVDVRRLDDVSRVIDASLAKGANEISSLAFYSSKADSVRQSAMAAAVARARADADVLARAAGGMVGPLLELSSTDNPSAPIPRMAMAKSMASVATPIEPGEQTFSATVTVRWAFVPNR